MMTAPVSYSCGRCKSLSHMDSSIRLWRLKPEGGQDSYSGVGRGTKLCASRRSLPQPAAASRHRCATCRWPTSVWTVSIVQFNGPFGKPLHPPIHIAGSPDEHSTRTCEAVPAQYLTCTRQVFGVSHHPATVPHYSTRCEQLSVARRGQEGMLCMAADLPAPWL